MLQVTRKALNWLNQPARWNDPALWMVAVVVFGVGIGYSLRHYFG